MGNYNFRKDKRREETVLDFLVEHLGKDSAVHKIVQAPPVKFPDWDLHVYLADGESHTVEVKEDRYAAKSNNIFVEYESRGKESGIKTSKASYFLYCIHRKNCVEFVKIPTEDLLRLAENNGKWREGCGDKGSNTKGYTLPVDYVKDYKFFSIGTDDYESKLKLFK